MNPTTTVNNPTTTVDVAEPPTSHVDPIGNPTTTSVPDVSTPETVPPTGAAAHRVITNADRSALANGFTVPAGQLWEFDPNQSVAIEVSRNVQVQGVLRMRPSSANVDHLLKFVGVNEGQMVGSGMSVLDTDVGLWVTGAGQLDLHGTPRTGWTSLSGSASAGADQITLATAPVGWRVGDELSIAPTAAPSTRQFSTQFDVVTIKSVSGRIITLSTPLKYSHPAVNGEWTAEVMNLTRNVRIEGQGSGKPQPEGRAHVLIMSSKAQSVKYAQLRHLGARRISNDRDPTVGVLGRYSLHFHHNGDGSRGSIVEGVVVRNSGNSAYVPHASNGITFRDNIAFDGWENAFWWDQPAPQTDERTHDTFDLMIDHNIVALLRDDPDFRGYRLSGFTLATGKNMTIRNSVAVGVQGNKDANGFRWPENSNEFNIWEFSQGNIAHNNRADGIFVWQNNSNRHVVSDFVAYNNGESGIDHGAYLNAYQYSNLRLFGNGEAAITQHTGAIGRDARSDGYGMAFENVRSDGVLKLAEQRLRSSRPALYKNCSFSAVNIENGGSKDNPGLYDFVDCGLEAGHFIFSQVEPGTVIRVQNGQTAFQLDSSGRRAAIAPFYSN